MAPFYISETITSWILHSDLSGKMTSSELSKGLNPGKRQTIKVFTNKQTNKHGCRAPGRPVASPKISLILPKLEVMKKGGKSQV